MMTSRFRILLGTVVLIGLGLLSLLWYSLDRTAWAFALFETGRPNAATKGMLAAFVLEAAIIALVLGQGVAFLVNDSGRQAAVLWWAKLCLAASLGMQFTINITAGFLWGSRPLRAELAATSFVDDQVRYTLGGVPVDGHLASYMIQAVLLLVVNGSLPLVIYGLAKILAMLLPELMGMMSVRPTTQTVRASWRWPTLPQLAWPRMPAWPRAVAPPAPVLVERPWEDVQKGIGSVDAPADFSLAPVPQAAPLEESPAQPPSPEQQAPSSWVRLIEPDSDKAGQYTRLLALTAARPTISLRDLMPEVDASKGTVQKRRAELVGAGLLRERDEGGYVVCGEVVLDGRGMP